MNTALYVLAGIVGIGALWILFAPLTRLYIKFRGTRVITCPDNQKAAAVQVNAVRAALSSVGTRELQLKQCSRWPEKQNCGQECLAQIEAAPEDCLVRTILTRWYQEKDCVICGKPLGEIDWLQHKPGFRAPDQTTMEWNQVAPEKLPEVLATHSPVCWNCHIAATFRRRYPDLVVDRRR